MKKGLFYLLFIYLILLSSCNNIYNFSSKTMTFGLGESAVNEITKAAGPVVNENSIIKVDCQVKDEISTLQSKSLKLDELYKVEFTIDNLQIGKSIQIELKVYVDNKLIYTGISDVFKITGGEEQLCSIPLELYKSKITYYDSENQIFSQDFYTVKDNHKIISGEKPGYEFLGWFYDKDCNEEFTLELGKDNFLGDVNLYGKWKNIPPKEIESPSFRILSDCIELSWVNPSDVDLAEVLITSDDGTVNKKITDSSLLLPTKNAVCKVTAKDGIDKSKQSYNFNVQLIDKGGLSSNVVKIGEAVLPEITNLPSVPDQGPDSTSFTVNITGKNLTAEGVTPLSFNFNIPGLDPETGVTIVSDSEIKLNFSELPETNNNSPYKGTVSFIKGTKEYSYNVRDYEEYDIVYEDGSLSKAKLPSGTAVAVIFKPGSKGNALGIALEDSGKDLIWTTGEKPSEGSLGPIDFINLEKINCTMSDRDPFACKIEGDTDGSDNWEYICSVDPEAEMYEETKYPVFYYGNHYGETQGYNEIYSAGWYVPSLAELLDFYIFYNSDKGRLNNLLNTVGSEIVETSHWTSNQCYAPGNDGKPDCVFKIWFDFNQVSAELKSVACCYARCIRKF